MRENDGNLAATNNRSTKTCDRAVVRPPRQVRTNAGGSTSSGRRKKYSTRQLVRHQRETVGHTFLLPLAMLLLWGLLTIIFLFGQQKYAREATSSSLWSLFSSALPPNVDNDSSSFGSATPIQPKSFNSNKSLLKRKSDARIEQDRSKRAELKKRLREQEKYQVSNLLPDEDGKIDSSGNETDQTYLVRKKIFDPDFPLHLEVYEDDEWEKVNVSNRTNGSDPKNASHQTMNFSNYDSLPSWMKAYIELNDNNRQSPLSSAKRFGRKPPTALDIYKYRNHENGKRLNPFLKWMCYRTCGGAGDRLSGIIQAFYVSMCRGRVFYISWTTPQPLQSVLEPNFIDWAVPTPYTGSFLPISALDVHRSKHLTDPYLIPDNVTGVSVRSNIWLTEGILLGRKKLAIPAVNNTLNNSYKTQTDAVDEINYDSAASPIDNSSNFTSGFLNSTNTTSCLADYLSQFKDGPSARYLYRTAFWTLFKWSPAVISRVDFIRKYLGMTTTNVSTTTDDTTRQSYFSRFTAIVSGPKEPVPYVPYVAIHVRTGRGATFLDPFFRTNNESAWPLYYNCAKALQRGIEEKCTNNSSFPAAAVEFNSSSNNDSNETNSQFAKRNIPIYLAADTLDVKRAMLQWDNETGSNSIRALLDMEIYHIDRSNAKLFNGDHAAAQLDVWADMKLLIESTCLVMSPSKYSRLGQILSDQQPRCAVLYDDCGEERLRKALRVVRTPCT